MRCVVKTDLHGKTVECFEERKRTPNTFLTASQFSSLIGMGAPRRTTLSTSSAASIQQTSIRISLPIQEIDEDYLAWVTVMFSLSQKLETLENHPRSKRVTYQCHRPERFIKSQQQKLNRLLSLNFEAAGQKIILAITCCLVIHLIELQQAASLLCPI